ncbi:MAG: hypothetical protein AB7U18_08325, partial [Dehalococcoidia bacterium]
FVRYGLMRDIAKAAHALGMWHTTITSAVWCKSQAFARERLAELQRYGLRTVSISYDSFHEPWVTPDQIKHCIAAGADLGLTVLVAGSVTRDSQGARALLGDWPDQFPTVTVGDGPVQPTGRGATIPLARLLVEDFGAANLVCPVTSDLLIQTDGATYPCCSTGGDYDYLVLGNARETPLVELRARAEHALWYQIITRHGFAKLEALVRRYHPAVQFPRQHIGVCNLCALVFGQSELGAAVRDALARFEEDRTRAAVTLWARLRPALAVATSVGTTAPLA